MARAKSNGSYAPLSSTYYRDDAILEAGEAAELMFVRCLAFCSESSSDGFITDRQILVVVGMGLADVPERVATLVSVGVLERKDGGYIVRSWLKWNRSSAQIGRYLKRDRVRKADAKAATDAHSARNPAGIRAEQTRNPAGTDPESARTDDGFRLPITTQQYINTLSDESDVFETFYELYPKKTNKTAAKRKWTTITKKVEPAAIVAGLRAQLPLLLATDKQFVQSPDVWLNKGKWADEVQTPPTAVAEPRDQWDRITWVGEQP